MSNEHSNKLQNRLICVKWGKGFHILGKLKDKFGPDKSNRVEISPPKLTYSSKADLIIGDRNSKYIDLRDYNEQQRIRLSTEKRLPIRT